MQKRLPVVHRLALVGIVYAVVIPLTCYPVADIA